LNRSEWRASMDLLLWIHAACLTIHRKIGAPAMTLIFHFSSTAMQSARTCPAIDWIIRSPAPSDDDEPTGVVSTIVTAGVRRTAIS
jgi:hypothetical protein